MKNQLTLIGTGAILLLFACSSTDRGEQSDAPGKDLPVSRASAQALDADQDVREELAAVLIEYFGQPSAPHFARLEEWEEHGFDPNASPLDGDRSADERLTTPAADILADNQQTWAAELARIEAGAVTGVGPWPLRSRMNRSWRELKAQRDTLGADEFKRRATLFFAERCPDLEEAAQLFMPICSRCHGRDGSGEGPMSERIKPRPRNFHYGVFKFAAVESGSKPMHADLVRTLEQGLPGSLMPAYGEYSLGELSALVDYVRYVSIRGEVELLIVSEWLNEDLRPNETVAEMYALVWERWLEAPEYALSINAPLPDPDATRLTLGEAVYHDPHRGNCMSCHGADGKGSGPSAYGQDENGELYALLRDDWGNINLPHDLTDGLFRGGSLREDLYTRIHCGIPGTAMPALGLSLNADGQPLLSEEEKWAVVDYVLSLSNQGPLVGM